MRILSVLFLALLMFSCKNGETSTNGDDTTTVATPVTTYYLIRHAEKDRSNPENPDPSLVIEGFERSQRWATYFETTKLDEVFSTNFLRTKQTVSILAQQKALSIKPYEPNTLYSDVFLKNTQGKNILIVGHSNTIPKLVNQIMGEEKFQDMADTDNSTLYKVTITENNKNVEVITVK